MSSSRPSRKWREGSGTRPDVVRDTEPSCRPESCRKGVCKLGDQQACGWQGRGEALHEDMTAGCDVTGPRSHTRTRRRVSEMLSRGAPHLFEDILEDGVPLGRGIRVVRQRGCREEVQAHLPKRPDKGLLQWEGCRHAGMHGRGTMRRACGVC